MICSSSSARACSRVFRYRGFSVARSWSRTRLRESLSPSLRDSISLCVGVRRRLGSPLGRASSCCSSTDLLSHPRATERLYDGHAKPRRRSTASCHEFQSSCSGARLPVLCGGDERTLLTLSASPSIRSRAGPGFRAIGFQYFRLGLQVLRQAKAARDPL
jgi:hypothetical protein